MLFPLALIGPAYQTTPVAPGAKVATAAFAITSSKSLVGVHAICIAAAPTGDRIACGMENNSIRIIDAVTRQTVKTLEGHTRPVQAIAWSPDGRYIASGDERAKIYVWDTKTWTRVKDISGHTKQIQWLDFNATTTQLLSTGQDDDMKVWVLADTKKEKLNIPGGGANFYGGKFIGKTNDIAVATLQQGARLYTASKTMKGWLTGHGGRGILAVSYNPAGTRAVTAGRDNDTALFDTKSSARLGYFKGHEDWVISSIFSPNGKWVVTSSSDRTVRVWNPNNFKEVLKLDNQKAIGSPLVFTADGKYLITVDIGDNLVIHQLNPSQGGSAAKSGATKPVRKRTKRGG